MTNLVSLVEIILIGYQNDSLKVSVRTQGAQQLPHPLTTYMCQLLILFYFSFKKSIVLQLLLETNTHVVCLQ